MLSPIIRGPTRDPETQVVASSVAFGVGRQLAPAGSEVYLSVVVPAWNGGGRLRATLHSISAFLQHQQCATELIVIDDHSDRPTADLLEEFSRSHNFAGPKFTVIRNDRNRGKGYSVSRGISAAQGKYRVFMDADLAYPASEIAKIVRDMEDGADVAIACRVLPNSRYVMSPAYFRYLYTRHVMSRIFNAIVRLTILPGVPDTQAGLKGFTADAARTIFPRLTIHRFGFDLECLFIARAHGFRIANTAVDFHYDDEPTTVDFVRDVFRMMRDIMTVRWNGWRGNYR
jgi:dolichyl-phosphate beta-glucosyltransferase